MAILVLPCGLNPWWIGNDFYNFDRRFKGHHYHTFSCVGEEKKLFANLTFFGVCGPAKESPVVLG